MWAPVEARTWLLAALLIAGLAGVGCAGPSAAGSNPTSAAGSSSGAPQSAAAGPASKVTIDDLRRVALRSGDLGTGWTAQSLPRSDATQEERHPCNRPHGSDSARGVVHQVGLARAGQPVQVAQTLAAYGPGTATVALSELREAARGCPRSVTRSANGSELAVDIVLDEMPPPYGDDRVLLARRVTTANGIVYSAFLVFRNGDVLTSISSIAATGRQAGELVGVAATRAAERISASPVGS